MVVNLAWFLWVAMGYQYKAVEHVPRAAPAHKPPTGRPPPRWMQPQVVRGTHQVISRVQSPHPPPPLPSLGGLYIVLWKHSGPTAWPHTTRATPDEADKASAYLRSQDVLGSIGHGVGVSQYCSVCVQPSRPAPHTPIRPIDTSCSSYSAWHLR